MQWSSTSPIFKLGDPDKPENYRGIALNSCVGNFFNSILNNKLDNFLKENNIISEYQIDFTKKPRTSNHTIVLKTLINILFF